MVHRAPDSRLLTNLIANEREYTKHLAHLFPLANTALTSLSAYAAASPSSPARTLATVVDLLASADDALQRYNNAIETWRDQLLALKDLEDNLSAVLRDRDILVTRLIKVSKATREAHRSSRLITPLTGLGSPSLASLPSTNSTTATHTVSASGTSPASTNAKLAQAQAELQACQAHLVSKELELDARRISIARDGLGARCRALIDCGWVWGEMGKQGLKALQALSVNGLAHTAALPTYASDNSSLTPSQSASQTVARSVETSHEGPTTSREHERTTEPEADLTITLPPAHAISELTLPTGVRQNGNPAHNGISAKPVLAPAPRRKRMKRPRRPPSQHIAEVSDEGSDGPASTANPNPNVDAGASPSPRTPFPTRTTNGTQDTSSEDEQPVGPFKVVENDPFGVIRKSMLGPSPSDPHLPTVPSVPASADASGETSPSKTAFPSLGAGRAAKRERRTSMAFFGSLRGLFRKPKERGRVDTEWDEGRSSPKQNGNGNGRGAATGWVTRTDARIKGRGGEADSDEDATPVVNVVRGHSGARLRKGRPRGMHESGSMLSASQDGMGVGVDGWVTDSHRPSDGGAGLDRSRTHRGTMKRRKMSVADLRGSEQGHTDGEVDGRLSSEWVSSKGRGMSEVVEQERGRILARRESVSKGVPSDTNAIADLDIQHSRRAATTTAATSSHKPSETHRRSASLSLVDTHVTFVSTSTSTGGNASWRKPPPTFESAPRAASPSRSKTTSRASTELPPKPHARRHFGNGHAAQNQSLMSIVADVTAHPPNEGEDKTRSLDMPRAPGSVLRETAEVGRRASLTMGTGIGEGSARGRGQGVVKMPLKSALRNTSRTPSPSPVLVPVRVEEKQRGVEEDGALRDSVSISSYETGRESLDGEERVPSPPLFTFPPPPVDPPPVKETTVVRKKSVRVPLQPTVSPAPPALCDDDADVWADSTSEEEVYRRARGLLRLAGKDGKGKKGRR